MLGPTMLRSLAWAFTFLKILLEKFHRDSNITFYTYNHVHVIKLCAREVRFGRVRNVIRENVITSDLRIILQLKIHEKVDFNKS